MPVVDMLFCVAMVEALGSAPAPLTSGPAWTGPSAPLQVGLLGERAVSDPLFCLRASRVGVDAAARIHARSRFPANAVAMREDTR